MNPARGDIIIQHNDDCHVLCLTMGALAEIEGVLNGEDVRNLGQRLALFGRAELSATYRALCRGGGTPGADPVSLDRVTMAEAVACAFEAALAGEPR